MLTERVPDVSVENVEAGIPSGSTIGIFVTRVLLETWCAHELPWVVSGSKSSGTCAGILGAYGRQRPYGETKLVRLFCDL